MKVLLSIKENFANKIFCGEKKFEYRKRIFQRETSTVVVYVTMPIGRIVGEFTIESILCESPISLWDKTEKYSGVEKDFFFQYFDGHTNGYAIKISNAILYDEPINPYENDTRFFAPQSFKYL